MITEDNALLVIALILVFMGIMTFLVLFLIRRRIGTRIVETEVNTNSRWSLGTAEQNRERNTICASNSELSTLEGMKTPNCS